MSVEFVTELARGAILESIIISAPILGISLIVGLIVAVFQTTTNIQEQTLTFVPKILAMLFAVAFFGSFIIYRLIGYTFELFRLIPGMTGM
jgi:flagellar biosynthetic protein FliQ